MKRVSVALIGLLFLSICLCADGQKARKIEFRMTPVKSATYNMHAETTTEYVSYRSRGTEKRTLDFKADMRVLLRCVKATSDGVVHLEITYPDFTLETTMTEKGRTSMIISDGTGARSFVDGKLQEQTTWEELEKRGSPNLRKLFNSSIAFTLDSTGKVLEVKAPPELSTRFTWVDVKQFFRNQVIFPDVPVAPGAEWNLTTEREVPRGPGPFSGKIMVDEATYEYQGNETASGRECARIRAFVTSRPKEKVPNLNEFKQTYEGWALVGLENGQLVMSEMKLFQEMKGTPGGIKTEVKTTGRVRTSLAPGPGSEGAAPEKKPPAGTK